GLAHRGCRGWRTDESRRCTHLRGLLQHPPVHRVVRGDGASRVAPGSRRLELTRSKCALSCAEGKSESTYVCRPAQAFLDLLAEVFLACALPATATKDAHLHDGSCGDLRAGGSTVHRLPLRPAGWLDAFNVEEANESDRAGAARD